MQFGNVAEWVAAIGTVGTLVAALLVLRKELDERREERDLRRRSHARTIAAWAEERTIRDEGYYREVEHWIHARNASDAPIHDAVVYVFHPIGRSQTESGVAAPDIEYVIGTLAPGDTFSERIKPESIDYDRIVFPGLVAEVAFTDSAGIHWRRLVNGALEEQELPPRMC